MSFSAAASRIALATVLALAASFAVAATKTLATVDGQPITDQDVSEALSDIGQGLPQGMDEAGKRKYALDYLIDLKLVAKKGLADKVEDDPDFQRKLAYYHDKLAMEEVLGKAAKAADTDKAEHEAYDAAAKAQPPQEEIHARHILLPTEAAAKAALARVKAGEDFGKVATELSKDPSAKGGDLGWFTKDRMVPEFAEAAFKLKKGEISEPVKTQFGWHIIQVEDTRMKTFPPFDQVKEQASHYVQQKAQADIVQQLRKDAKIERFDEAPAKPAATAPAAPAATPATPAK
ncbi:MAG TPA: peptidylprolyl isomerase [Roseiarcus sp.]|nr:peptidylprolyl isomerase [Roseiarcus sp.]